MINLLSLEGVSGARYPVNTVTVKTPGQTTVSGATHLESQVASTLHHATEDTIVDVGRDRVDPLAISTRDYQQN